MVKHIVMFKLVAFDTPEAKAAKLAEIKTGLEALVDKIEVLKSMKVGINANPAEIYDFVLVSEFEKMEDVEVYAKHPEHVAVAQIIGAVKDSRAGVDFIV
ncbi:Dabb family protein [Parabacteroides sp. FAFU027]|uniref:Dabb family protein n=1 Tax=Parabacteroides sp. FAFU027 TaxID=2922715 RepID=UPI001FAECF5C|nr:Dabb family protein [Parabacteroides sp. FAFU027]